MTSSTCKNFKIGISTPRIHIISVNETNGITTWKPSDELHNASSQEYFCTKYAEMISSKASIKDRMKLRFPKYKACYLYVLYWTNIFWKDLKYENHSAVFYEKEAFKMKESRIGSHNKDIKRWNEYLKEWSVFFCEVKPKLDEWCGDNKNHYTLKSQFSIFPKAAIFAIVEQKLEQKRR